MDHPYMNGLYLSSEGKRKLYKIAQTMADKAMEAIEELPEEEREIFWDYCDKMLQSGSSGLRYVLSETFIPDALGLDISV